MSKYKVLYRRSNKFVDIGHVYAKSVNEAIDKFCELEEFEQIEIINVEKVNGI